MILESAMAMIVVGVVLEVVFGVMNFALE